MANLLASRLSGYTGRRPTSTSSISPGYAGAAEQTANRKINDGSENPGSKKMGHLNAHDVSFRITRVPPELKEGKWLVKHKIGARARQNCDERRGVKSDGIKGLLDTRVCNSDRLSSFHLLTHRSYGGEREMQRRRPVLRTLFHTPPHAPPPFLLPHHTKTRAIQS